jgi:phosphatidylserine/phosphatidylglycerophosphate/cardiolipin synthase-like enzyme
MNQDFATIVGRLVAEAPKHWITSVCETLRSVSATAPREWVLQKIPASNNSNIICMMRDVVCLASGQMSWEALSWALDTAQKTYANWQATQDVELLWAGPSPADQISARRIDQVLYDLVATAKQDILLITFAATRIERLTDALLSAIQRGAKVRLVLEFEHSSEGQLSYDALKAFPPALTAASKIYHWPVENRERNQAGRPGKLHAKLAIIDDTALISSANLTDDAFNRNLEIGVMVRNVEFLQSVKNHFDQLIENDILRPVS